MPSSTGSSLRATACEKPSPKYPGLTAPDRHEPINPPTGAAARDQSERCPRSIGITARNHRNTQLVRSGADFDIFFTDALGTRSAKADGATVSLGSTNEQLGILNILVTYSGTGVLESYLFNLAAKNVAYTVTKTRTPVPLARLLVASCQ